MIDFAFVPDGSAHIRIADDCVDKMLKVFQSILES